MIGAGSVLRFLNVVEAGAPLKLSPTRIGMWVAVGVVVSVAWRSPDNLGATLTGLGAVLPLVLNYIHQRSVFGASDKAALQAQAGER